MAQGGVQRSPGNGRFVKCLKARPARRDGRQNDFCKSPALCRPLTRQGGLAVLIVFRYPRATLRFALGHTLAPVDGNTWS